MVGHENLASDGQKDDQQDELTDPHLQQVNTLLAQSPGSLFIRMAELITDGRTIELEGNGKVEEVQAAISRYTQAIALGILTLVSAQLEQPQTSPPSAETPHIVP